MLIALQKPEGLNCMDKFALFILPVLISRGIEDAVFTNSEQLFEGSYVCSHSKMMSEWHLRLSEVSYIFKWPS